jgi:hypothetical protein
MAAEVRKDLKAWQGRAQAALKVPKGQEQVGEEVKEQVLSGEADLTRKDLEHIATLGAEL